MLTEVHITRKMGGKMMGFTSINTSPMNNPYCMALAKTDAVCGSCYSVRAMKQYKNADACFQRNGELLSTVLLEDWQLPRFKPRDTIRFSAHGELINGTHAANLIAICTANPDTVFTLWTKRVDLMHKVIRDFGKPDNLILIRSSVDINVQADLPQYFDKVFTVYDKAHKEAEFINCGAKKCADCMTCYTKTNTTVYVNEVVK